MLASHMVAPEESQHVWAHYEGLSRATCRTKQMELYSALSGKTSGKTHRAPAECRGGCCVGNCPMSQQRLWPPPLRRTLGHRHAQVAQGGGEAAAACHLVPTRWLLHSSSTSVRFGRGVCGNRSNAALCALLSHVRFSFDSPSHFRTPLKMSSKHLPLKAKPC